MVDHSVKYQYYATICANIISLAHGLAVGWTSPFLPQLISIDSPLPSGPITTEEASWIGSLLCLGALTGTLLFGWMADYIGRKKSACAIAFPQMACWIFIFFAKSVEYLFIARFFAGIAAGGVFVVIPLYVTEISEDKIRGSLGSIMIFALNVGTLICFILGTYVKYLTVQGILFFIPVAFLICFLFLPETPAYLMKNNRPKEAEEALRYLRGIHGTSSEVSENFKIELDKLTSIKSNEEIMKEGHSSKITLDDFKAISVQKGIIIGIVLVAMNQFSGCFALINYTAQIFEEANTGLDPNVSAIVVGVIQIAGSYGSTFFVDRAGRRKLYMVSALGSALGLVVMGTFSYLKVLDIDVSSYGIIPVLSLSFVIFIASCGILPLAFIIISEIVPQKLRSFVTSLCMAILWFFAFIVIKYFSALVEAIGIHGSMWLFAGCCLAGFVFFAAVVPETKGKSFDEILVSLDRKVGEKGSMQ